MPLILADCLYIALQQQKFSRFKKMLQATIYADRQATDCGVKPHSRFDVPRAGFLQGLANAVRFGQTWLQGSPFDKLNDHLLQDIGMTRADLEALRR
jgi:hypothetical protein